MSTATFESNSTFYFPATLEIGPEIVTLTNFREGDTKRRKSPSEVKNFPLATLSVGYESAG